MHTKGSAVSSACCKPLNIASRELCRVHHRWKSQLSTWATHSHPPLVDNAYWRESGGSLDDLGHLMSHGSRDQTSDDVARNNASHTSVWFGECCEPSRAEHVNHRWRHLGLCQSRTQLREQLQPSGFMQQRSQMFIVIPDGPPAAPLRDDLKLRLSLSVSNLNPVRAHGVEWGPLALVVCGSRPSAGVTCSDHQVPTPLPPVLAEPRRVRPTAPTSPLVLLSTPDHRFDAVVTDAWTRPPSRRKLHSAGTFQSTHPARTSQTSQPISSWGFFRLLVVCATRDAEVTSTTSIRSPDAPLPCLGDLLSPPPTQISKRSGMDQTRTWVQSSSLHHATKRSS